MFLADKPGRFDEPGQCVALPGRTHDENGGVMLDGVYDGVRGDVRLWLSYAGLQKITAQFGDKLNLVRKDSLDSALTRIASLEHDLNAALGRAEEAEAKLSRINGVSRDGFKVVRQTGRPAQKKVAA